MTFQERLSWLKTSDRLKPIITIVVYWSEDKWKGPLHLQDMIDIPPGLEPFVDNNSIFLVQPSALTDEELEQCDSELGLVFRAIKSANLEELAHSDDRYQSISSAAANVIEAVVRGMGDLLSKNANQKGVVNMTRTMQAYSESLIKQGEEKMKPRITALEQKTTALEQQANEANQKASAAEQKATAAEQKATAAEQKANAAEQRATAAEQEANEANQKVASLEEKQRTSELAYRRLMSVNRMIAQGKSRTEIIKTLFLNDDEAAEWLVDVQ